jgi:hypothetical protein
MWYIPWELLVSFAWVRYLFVDVKTAVDFFTITAEYVLIRIIG